MSIFQKLFLTLYRLLSLMSENKQKKRSLTVTSRFTAFLIFIKQSSADDVHNFFWPSGLVVTAAFHKFKLEISNTHNRTFHGTAFTKLIIHTHVTKCTSQLQNSLV